MLVWAPGLWPETAQQWYARYETHFWQGGWLLAGFREFPREQVTPNWQLFDVDAGPVLAGYGTAASAFGIGAARANGDWKHAYPLSAQALVASWPLPDGRLLLPGFLSNLSDAPFTGESALLFSLTRQPVTNGTGTAGPLPFSVYLGVGVYIVVALAWLGAAVMRVKRWEREFSTRQFTAPGWQLTLWWMLVGIGALALMASWQMTGVLLVLAAQFLPRSNSRPVHDRALGT
jgi:hypothetical protein